MPHKVGRKNTKFTPFYAFETVVVEGILNIRKSPADVTYTFPAGRF